MPKAAPLVPSPPRLSRSSRWLSISSLRNAILGNHIIEYLKKNRKTNKNSNYSNENYVMSQGNTFEEHVLRSILNKFPLDSVDLSEHKFSEQRYTETLAHLRRGTSVIAQGALRNYQDMTMGFPDLILKGSAFKDLFSEQFLERLPEALKESVYYIIDIKWSTLNLKADNVGLLKTPQTVYYQSQVTLYTTALNVNLPGNKAEVAFILGRGYQGTGIKSDNCFDALAVVDLKGESYFKDCLLKALHWTRRLPGLLEKPLLNIKTLQNDSRSNKLRNDAIAQGNITCLWGCNEVNQRLAAEKGITSFRDVRCTPEALGIPESSYKAKVLHRILKVNKENTERLVSPKRLPPGSPIQECGTAMTEVFLDFEAVSCLFDNFSTFPIKETRNRIFLIGYTTNDRVYHRNLSEDLTDASEEKIFLDFLRFCQSKKEVKVFHWGAYESVNMRKLYARYPQGQGVFPETSLNLTDVCAYIKSIPLAIRGCYNFSIKSVYPALVALSLIQSPLAAERSDLENGLDAMIQAYAAYTGTRNAEKLTSVLTYNQSDCDHLLDIVLFLRTLSVP